MPDKSSWSYGTSVLDQIRLEERVQRSIRALADFPELGAELGGAFAPRRFLLGLWRWMIVIYRFYPESDLVAILAIADGRTSTSPTAHR